MLMTVLKLEGKGAALPWMRRELRVSLGTSKAASVLFAWGRGQALLISLLPHPLPS